MPQEEFEMPDEYKKNLAHLAEFLEAREGYRAQIKAARARGVKPPAHERAMVDEAAGPVLAAFFYVRGGTVAGRLAG